MKRLGPGKRPGSPGKVDEDLLHLITGELLTSFPEPLMVYDTNEKVIFANSHAIESLGFDPGGMARTDVRKEISLGADEIPINIPAPIRNIYYEFKGPDGQPRRAPGRARRGGDHHGSHDRRLAS